MMHVCHFSETALEGEYFRNISKGLMEKGIRVSLVELGPANPPSWISEQRDVGYHALDCSSKASTLLAAFKLATLVKREEVDILHTHLFRGGLVGVLTKLFQRRAVVALMRHHTGVVRLLGTWVHVAIDRWSARNADRCLTVSDSARNYMRHEDGIRRDIEVAYLGFDFERFKPNAELRREVRQELGFQDNEFVVGYVANFAPGKGHVQLVRAFGEARSSVPNAKLLLVGNGRLAEVDEAIIECGLSDRVIYGGWRRDVHACLGAMDLFVQPSLSEAFSQVLVEAMGVGLPVVATDVGAAAEVIRDGENGILTPPGDEAALTAAIRRLAADEKLSGRLGVAARNDVVGRFTVESMVNRHVDLYRSWMKG